MRVLVRFDNSAKPQPIAGTLPASAQCITKIKNEMKEKFIYIIIILMNFSLKLQSQDIINQKYILSDNSYNISFDIINANPNDTLTISLYCSSDLDDKFYYKLIEVTGDVGDNVLPGKNKLIKWYFKKDKIILYSFEDSTKNNKPIFKIIIHPKINYSIFKDNRDGNIYKTIKIGDFTWFAENLRYKINNESWCYKDDNHKTEPNSYSKVYGRLYSLKVAKKVCPNGWHLSKSNEWENLLNNLGHGNLIDWHTDYNIEDLTQTKIGYNLDKLYNELIEGGRSGFKALLAGRIEHYGGCSMMDATAFFWVDDSKMPDSAVTMDYLKTVDIGSYGGFIFNSIRCVKNLK